MNKNILSKVLASNNAKYVLMLILLFICTWAVFSLYLYSNRVHDGLASNLIRLHIVANSNSQEDQNLKIKVRDDILGFMGQRLKDQKSAQDAKYMITNSLDEIKSVADATLNRLGYSYPISVSLATYPFPTKVYGDIALPAGDYEALRVSIGNASGANWWCVLFPPLCYLDICESVVADPAKEHLKETLTDEEYQIVTSVSTQNSPARIKFKIVEILQKSKMKAQKVLSRSSHSTPSLNRLSSAPTAR